MIISPPMYSAYYCVFTFFCLVFGFAHLVEYSLILRYDAKSPKYKIYTLYFTVRTTLQVAMAWTLCLKKPDIMRLYTEMAEYSRSHAPNSYESRMCERFKAQTRSLVVKFSIFVTFTCFMLVLNSKVFSSRRNLMFPSFTFSHTGTPSVFATVYTIQFIFLIQIILTQSLLMYIYISAINQLSCQMRILQYKLERVCEPQSGDPRLVPRPNLKRGDEILMNVVPSGMDEASIHRRLYDAIAHHGKILIFKNKIGKIFGAPILVFTVINECYLCLLGYSLALQSESTFVAKLKIIFMIITSLILTFLHCLYGEKLQTEGEHLSNAIYFVPWYNQSRAFKKYLILMNEMSRKKIALSPYRIKDIGLPLLVQVINTIFSLYNVISATVH